MAPRPLIEAFARSGRCPEKHRYHAASTLALLALFVSIDDDEPDTCGLPWHRLSPDALVAASLEERPREPAFLRDLLDVSAAFYSYLADLGVLRHTEALKIRMRLVELAMGFA